MYPAQTLTVLGFNKNLLLMIVLVRIPIGNDPSLKKYL